MVLGQLLLVVFSVSVWDGSGGMRCVALWSATWQSPDKGFLGVRGMLLEVLPAVPWLVLTFVSVGVAGSLVCHFRDLSTQLSDTRHPALLLGA